MKVFLDTNVLLDYLLGREGVRDAVSILQLANAGCFELLVSDLTIANISYITRKTISRSDFYRVMRNLGKYYTIIPIGKSVVEKALVEQWNDFEDSLQCFSAENSYADIILTRNVQDFSRSSINVLSPSDFLKSLPLV